MLMKKRFKSSEHKSKMKGKAGFAWWYSLLADFMQLHTGEDKNKKKKRIAIPTT